MIALWLATPEVLLRSVEDAALRAGRERLFLSASLNALPFYERAGFLAVREELYPHRSGIGIPSVLMEKQLARWSGLHRLLPAPSRTGAALSRGEEARRFPTRIRPVARAWPPPGS